DDRARARIRRQAVRQFEESDRASAALMVLLRSGWSGTNTGMTMKLPRRQFLHVTAGVAALPALWSSATAQNYPTRPVRLVVPFPPGGGYDAVGRPWAEKIKPLLGTVIVENMGGGGSSLGAAAAARAQPDGYTLLLGGSSTHITEALLKRRPLY